MRRHSWFILILATLWAAVVWGGPTNGGLALSYASPKGDFAQQVDPGWGAAFIFDYPMAGPVNFTGTAGFYRFSGLPAVPGSRSETDNLTLWEFAAGPQLDFGVLYLGCEAGYYTDLAEWGLTPNVGIRRRTLDVGLRYKVTPDGKFLTARLGVFF